MIDETSAKTRQSLFINKKKLNTKSLQSIEKVAE